MNAFRYSGILKIGHKLETFRIEVTLCFSFIVYFEKLPSYKYFKVLIEYEFTKKRNGDSNLEN